MPKTFKFTSFSLRDLLITIGPLTVLIVAAGYFAYKLLNSFFTERGDDLERLGK